MSLFIERPGILTTVQDLGRRGFRDLGINPGGVMDPAAARAINLLLGNEDNEAVLEMHFPGPQIRFETDVVASIGGADLTPMLDAEPVPIWTRFTVKAGSVLSFDNKRSGNRAYLAVKGGFKADKWFGSSSTNMLASRGGIAGRALVAGDRLECVKSDHTGDARVSISPWSMPHYRPFPTVRVLPGAEFAQLSDRSRELFFSQNFRVSRRSDRMGFRLAGDPLEMPANNMLSTAVSFGTIQGLPNGQLVILMADHQTTGGYPRIAHVITRDLPLVGQLGPGDKVAFHLVTVREAEELAVEFERYLNLIRVGSKFESPRIRS